MREPNNKVLAYFSGLLDSNELNRTLHTIIVLFYVAICISVPLTDCDKSSLQSRFTCNDLVVSIAKYYHTCPEPTSNNVWTSVLAQLKVEGIEWTQTGKYVYCLLSSTHWKGLECPGRKTICLTISFHPLPSISSWVSIKNITACSNIQTKHSRSANATQTSSYSLFAVLCVAEPCRAHLINYGFSCRHTYPSFCCDTIILRIVTVMNCVLFTPRHTE